MSTRINQSKIKRLTKTILCPQRYYREDVTGEFKRESTEAMIKGQVFEYRLTGALPPEGNIPVIPLLKNGNQSTDDKRIQIMVERFPDIMKQYGIKIIKSGFKIEVAIESGVTFYGTLDCLVEYKGRPYIMDIKLTANVTSTFGDFAWGSITEMHPDNNGTYVAHFDPTGKTMDLIQSHAYMYQIELLTKKRFGFLYAVFDYKPISEFKIIEVPYSDEGRASMLSRFSDTQKKLDMFEATAYKAIPSWDECSSCKIKDCLVKIEKDPNEYVDFQSISTLYPENNNKVKLPTLISLVPELVVENDDPF